MNFQKPFGLQIETALLSIETRLEIYINTLQNDRLVPGNWELTPHFCVIERERESNCIYESMKYILQSFF